MILPDFDGAYRQREGLEANKRDRPGAGRFKRSVVARCRRELVRERHHRRRMQERRRPGCLPRYFELSCRMS